MTVARLFVYGSLRRGARHHAELCGAVFLGEYRTAAGYGLEAIGEYWALVERPGLPDFVSGELFAVDETLLGLLDEFEGPDYRRGTVPVEPITTGGLQALEAAAEADQADTHGAAVSPSAHAGVSGENLLALAYLKRTR
jgi:gamma-glutamylcyclotransferase (GGCT)/AIG2-like uncharacterized protein YtfP